MDETETTETVGGQRRTLPLAAALGSLPVLAAAGWIGYSRLFVQHDMPLPPAVGGERRECTGRAGRLSFYVDGEGEPLLLIHSINAAASAYEVRPLFEHYRNHRRVFALDLPGFGFSERGDREYTPRLYVNAIFDMLDEIERETGAKQIDALAVSLGSEFLARAASEKPERFRSLALVSPTAFGAGEQFYEADGSVRGKPWVRQAFAFPLWGQAFFDLLNTEPSQRFFLAKTFGSNEAVDEGMLQYGYISAHQPGAQYAPFAFISGLLFSADIDRVYESITDIPVWLTHGARGDFTDYGDTDNIDNLPNWQVQMFNSGALPYFELPDQFISLYDRFLSRADSR